MVHTNLEVADKVFFATDGNVRGFTHVVTAIKPLYQVPGLSNAEHCGRHAVHCHNVTW